MTPLVHFTRLACGAALLLLADFSLLAAAPVEKGGKSLREAVARKELVSLESLLEWIEENYKGQVVEVELENNAGFFGYEIDLLSPTGSKIEFRFDARSGELLSISGRDIEQAKRK